MVGATNAWHLEVQKMSYDQTLAGRIRRRIGDRPDLTEREMFGGLAFLIQGRMSVGVAGNELMARVGRDAHDRFVARPAARIMDFTMRPIRGWISVAPEGLASDSDLDVWIEQGIASALAASKGRPDFGDATRRRSAKSATRAPVPEDSDVKGPGGPPSTHMCCPRCP